MKTKLQYFCILLALFVGFTRTACATVTFTNTPATVSNTYTGTISLQIGGLTNTETVLIQKYLDLNNNGVIDGGDPLVQQFNLTDGQVGMVIGGVTNFNVVGDLNATTGAITATLNFQNGDIAQNIVGKYLYRLSSPVGHFTPLTNSFTVTNFPYAQKFTGNVVSNSTGVTVSNAIIILLPPGQNGSPLAGVVANNAGSYTLSAPPGTYSLLVFHTNYVGAFNNAPVLTLGASQTITTNLTLTPATSSISGKVVDASNSTIGLPGANLFAQSAGGLCALAFTDTNGNFTTSVTADSWGINVSDQSLTVLGYLGPDNGTNVTSGATGLTFACAKATALIYGSVKDYLGNPFAALDVFGSDNNLYQTDAYTDANGNYVLGVVGLGASGSWQVQANDVNQLTNYIFSQPAFDQNGGTNLNAGQIALVNFTGILATNYITGNVKFDGTNVVGVGVYAGTTINSFQYNSYVDTDNNGNYSMNVANGTWGVGVNQQGGNDSLDNILGSGNYTPPNNQNVGITNNNGTANFIVQSSSSGPLQITTTLLPNGTNTTFYSQTLQASGGTPPYSWSVPNYSANPPANLSLSPSGVLSGPLSTTANTYYFDVVVNDSAENASTQTLSLTVVNPPLSPLVITNVSLPNGNVGAAYNVQLGATGGQTPYHWALALGSANPPPGLSLNTNGIISGTPTTNGLFNFKVQATDANSTVTNKVFGIIINPKPVLGLPTRLASQFQMLLTGASNQNYTVQMSTNLSSGLWNTLFITNSPATNAFDVVDPNATNNQRFYRILIGP